MMEHDLIEKIRALPADKVAEVSDFVDFLRARVQDERLRASVTKVSEASFEAAWDNEADAIYDEP